MKETPLYRRVQRVIRKAEKIGYHFNSLELDVFNAMGREEWDEDKIGWIVLESFDRLYDKLYKK